MSIAFVGFDWWLFGLEFDENDFLDLTEGDILFAFLSGVQGDTPAVPAGWEMIDESPVQFPNPSEISFAAMWVLWHEITAGDSGIYNFDNGDPETLGYSASFVEYSGVDTTNPVQAASSAQNGNATPILTLPSVTSTLTGSWLLIAENNQIRASPTATGFTRRGSGWVEGEGPAIFALDKPTIVGPSGDVEVVSFNELGNGWDLGMMMVLNPPVLPGSRFDCSSIDADIN